METMLGLPVGRWAGKGEWPVTIVMMLARPDRVREAAKPVARVCLSVGKAGRQQRVAVREARLWPGSAERGAQMQAPRERVRGSGAAEPRVLRAWAEQVELRARSARRVRCGRAVVRAAGNRAV